MKKSNHKSPAAIPPSKKQDKITNRQSQQDNISGEGGPDEPTRESQTKRRSGNQVNGSNH